MSLVTAIMEPFKSRFSKFDINLLKKENRDEFIEENKNFIYKITSNLCGRKLNWENDDELSIAMISFNKACDTFDQKRGNFYSYCKTVIKNSIYDYFRSCKNTPLLTFSNSDDDNITYLDNIQSIDKHEKIKENEMRAEEIRAFSKKLQSFGISFNSLIKNSPKHKDSRNRVLNLALLCLKNEEILCYINQKHRLPIKDIISVSNENRKFIDRWRIYLISLIIILSSNDYIYLKTYLNIKVGDKSD